MQILQVIGLILLIPLLLPILAVALVIILGALCVMGGCSFIAGIITSGVLTLFCIMSFCLGEDQVCFVPLEEKTWANSFSFSYPCHALFNIFLIFFTAVYFFLFMVKLYYFLAEQIKAQA